MYKKKGTVEKRSVGLIVEKLRDREVLELVCAETELESCCKGSESFRESSVGLLEDNEENVDVILKTKENSEVKMYTGRFKKLRAKVIFRSFEGQLEKLKTLVLKLNYEKIRENLEYEDLEEKANELRKYMENFKAEIVFLTRTSSPIDSMEIMSMEKSAEESLSALEKEITSCKKTLWPKLFGDCNDKYDDETPDEVIEKEDIDVKKIEPEEKDGIEEFFDDTKQSLRNLNYDEEEQGPGKNAHVTEDVKPVDVGIPEADEAIKVPEVFEKSKPTEVFEKS